MVCQLVNNESVFINGDGETSRGFCFIDNCVQANILAATVVDEAATNQIYNVAFGERTTLNTLYQLVKEQVVSAIPVVGEAISQYRISGQEVSGIGRFIKG